MRATFTIAYNLGRTYAELVGWPGPLTYWEQIHWLAFMKIEAQELAAK